MTFIKIILFFSNLARLVPSTEFEQKRRQINKHLLDEIEKDEEPVLCGKKKKKKKKKKKQTLEQYFGGLTQVIYHFCVFRCVASLSM